MASPLITLLDATVAYGDGLPPVLQNVSLNVHRGDWWAVTGPNGCGKTTLLAVLGGVIRPRDGVLERKDGLRSALLLQEPDNQFVATSVRNELALSVPLDVDSAGRSTRIDATIERFELGTLLDRNPHRLSGGEKQRLALATVWLEAPDVLLLDEPLSFLDDEMSERVVNFVRELNVGGTVVVWATPGDDVGLARDVLRLDQGRVVAGADFQSDVVMAPVSDVLGTRPKREPVTPVERVRFDSVSFAYGHVDVLENLSLNVSSGECVGIAGRNGSGKSTLLLLAGGALQATSGQITRRAPDRGVLYLPQSPERLFFAETVWEEISFGLARHGIKRGEAREQAGIALELAGLDPVEFASRPPFDLSFGEMRRVAFAIAFALKPELLLLDEPAACLDAAGRAVLGRLIDYSRAGNGAVMIASHGRMDSPDHDRVITLRGGRGG